MKLNLVVFASLILSVSASAAPTPITPAQVGPATVTFSSNSSTAFPYLVCPGVTGINGCGGAFRADIKSNAVGAPTIKDATVWCVDSQLDVSAGSSYYANIVSLSNTSALDDPTFTRYGTNGSPATQWRNPINAFNDSASRYKLVAALVMQYQDSNLSGDYSKPYDQAHNNSLTGQAAINLTARNDAIQRAIWWIMYNKVADPTPSPDDITGNLSAGVPAGYSDWVDWATHNVGSLDLSSWAVISGPAYSSGSLLPPSSGRYQTFLVQVQAAPEPAYLGLLAVGLGAILWFKRRRIA